jgi:multidrug resistance protein, MATE family
VSKSIYREIFRLGWPVFIGQVAVVANGVIDTIMAGRYSTVDLAGVGVGAAIYFSIFIALMGVLLALTPIASQLYGAGRYGEIGEEVRQSAWLAAALGAACFALLRYPDLYMALARLPPEVEERARGYLAAASWGVPAALLFRVFYGFSVAVSRPRVVMALNLIGLAIKIPLNLVFMYGNLGAPELGGVGCAVSSSVIAWVSCLLAWGWCFLEPGYRRYRVYARWSWPDARRLGHIVSLGLPIGFTFFVDVTGFTFMALFIARLGAHNSAAHQIAGNFAALMFMLPLALGNASSVLVGHAIGARQFARARATGLAGLTMGLGCALAVAALVSMSAQRIAAFYTSDREVLALAGALLVFVAVYHVFDAIQAVAVNVLRGYKRAVVPMAIYVVALWGVGLGGGYAIGLTAVDLSWFGIPTPWGARGFWFAAIASLALAGSLVTLYFLRVSRNPEATL